MIVVIDLLIQLDDVVVVVQIAATDAVVAASGVDVAVASAVGVVVASVAVVVVASVVVDVENSLPYHVDYDIVHVVMNWALFEPPYVIHL